MHKAPSQWALRASRRSTAGVVEPEGRLDILSRAEVSGCRVWDTAFANCRKDHRYYELLEDTVCPEFKYRYFAIRDRTGEIRAIQPFFILDQDLLVGTGSRLHAFTGALRRIWPRLIVLRTLMVGCAAGEGHLDGGAAPPHSRHVELLAKAII